MKTKSIFALLPALLFSVSVFTSCDEEEDPIPEVMESYTEPTNVLILSDGIAYNWRHGKDTHYYYDRLFTLNEYNKMSADEITNTVVTGNIDDRNLPDPDNFACYYNLYPNQEYVYVTVSYDTNGNRGETVVTRFKTKSSTSQPVAEILGCEYYEDNSDNVYYGWEVEKNTYCKEYYTYAVASKDYFKTLEWALDNATAILAWAILDEIKYNPEEHGTRINELTNGSEKLFAAQLNDGVSYLTANPYYDKYLQIVTWGTDSYGELSGLLDCELYNLDNSAEAPMSRVAVDDAVAKTPKSVVVNRNDISVYRVK